ncbi:MAG: hypothetical protein EBZ47_10055, partial [Chlamydiae bacterium]|nr:hypothetical protein [Chlamydiota bacterium]
MEYNKDAFIELNIASICERKKMFADQKRHKTLLDILGHDMGVLGRRKLNQCLRMPLNDAGLIRERYEKIDAMIDVETDYIKKLPDLEWLYLKWKRKKASYRIVGQFLMAIKDMIVKYFSENQEFIAFMEEVECQFDIDKMIKEDGDFIRIKTKELEEFELKMQEIRTRKCKIEEDYKNYFKLQESGEGFCLTGTIKKWQNFQFQFLENPLYEVSKNKSMVKLSNEELDKLSNIHLNLVASKKEYIRNSFLSLSKIFFENHDALLSKLIKEISEMDLYANLASYFKTNNYVRPILLPDKKILQVQELRHPIHEQIEKDKLFVPYTFELHDESLGILLYGMNSSGKSTLLKSLGLGVWLAQCGFYVPAKK